MGDSVGKRRILHRHRASGINRGLGDSWSTKGGGRIQVGGEFEGRGWKEGTTRPFDSGEYLFNVGAFRKPMAPVT